jgi:DNA-directed RNA polymerase specialized sigma24 family protein
MKFTSSKHTCPPSSASQGGNSIGRLETKTASTPGCADAQGPEDVLYRGRSLAQDEALDTLARIDGRKSRVVELRYFGGLNIEETAEALGVSMDTAKRDWRMARAWLIAELTSKQVSGGS